MSASNQQQDCTAAIQHYLLEKSVTFCRLTELRAQGWKNPAGDHYFARQRQTADESSARVKEVFYRMMRRIGRELQQETNGFEISQCNSDGQMILDFCTAPGGFLGTALEINPGAKARAFSLPLSSGGHSVLLPVPQSVSIDFIDITLLAADMGVTEIPDDHADAQNFLPHAFRSEQCFDLVICDGQVLRTHHRASYREMREARRLTVTQLALGLEHLRDGGKMIVLLHRLEVWDTVLLLHRFHQFSEVKVLKPRTAHQTRSSFYLVASNIRSQHPEALRAVRAWKDVWRAATFASDEEYANVIDSDSPPMDALLEQFGEELIRMGEPVWRIQADALANASYIKNRAIELSDSRN